jgi:hypothetical protein
MKAPAALASTPRSKPKELPPATAPEAAAWLMNPLKVTARRKTQAERLAAEAQVEAIR